MDQHDDTRRARGPGSPERWLEIMGDADQPKIVDCPVRGDHVPLHECVGCKRYVTLAIDPQGKHVYIDCQWDSPGDAPGE